MSQPNFKDQMKHSNTEFDGYLMVDWCAANEPKKGPDSVWYCFYDRMDGAWTMKNPRTRREATDGIASILYETTKHNRTVLVGFDFPFRYPAGFSSALGLHGKPPWRALWDELKETVIDDDKNRNNRFEVAASFNCRISAQPFPFWGRPETMTSQWISKKKERPHLAELRVTDQKAKEGVNLSKSSRFRSPGRGVIMWPMAAKPWERQEVQRASAPVGATYMFHRESNLPPRRAQGSLSPLPGLAVFGRSASPWLAPWAKLCRH